jgi:hypothetical protein
MRPQLGAFQRKRPRADRFLLLVGATIVACSVVVELSRRNELRVGQCLALLTGVMAAAGTTVLTNWWTRQLVCSLLSWEALNFHSCTLYFLLGLVAVVEVDPDFADLGRASAAAAVLLEFLAVVAPLTGFLAALDDILEPRWK